ncbi:MAG: family N-acetyltransferase [Frankiales bacterium]|nr:family N-acetyltransferase [Frankiales bacterium]
MTEADDATRALIDMLCALSTTCPDGWYERRSGAAAAISAVAARPLNRIIGERTEPDLDAVAELAARIEGNGLPYVVEARPGADDLPLWCRSRGFTDVGAVPLMTCSTAALIASQSVDVTWRSLGADGMEAHIAVALPSYGMPPDGLAGFERSTLLAQDFGAGLIAEVEGEPACTGVSLVADDWVGVFIVGTVPAYRRRGLGAALTAKLVTDAVARNGVRRALLQSSAMGKGVYESLGFATVETWTRWTTS